MIDRLRQILGGLQGRLSRRAEDAYKARDQATDGSFEEAYAQGQAQAYGESADAIRDAQAEADR